MLVNLHLLKGRPRWSPAPRPLTLSEWHWEIASSQDSVEPTAGGSAPPCWLLLCRCTGQLHLCLRLLKTEKAFLHEISRALSVYNQLKCLRVLCGPTKDCLWAAHRVCYWGSGGLLLAPHSSLKSICWKIGIPHSVQAFAELFVITVYYYIFKPKG